MARGVTQEQVNAAIEQLLLAGERPTIERVRATLGTGSPNTLTRMLDVWWQGLGQLLTAHRRSVAMPDAPAAVVDAASALWEAALAAAGEVAEAAVSESRRSLEEKEAALVSERQAHLAAIEAANLAHSTALQAQREAETRLQDLIRLADQQAGQVHELQERLALTERQTAELGTKLDSALSSARAAQAEAAQQRKDLETAHRAAEDRWLGEVDQLRQERGTLLRELQRAKTAAIEADREAKHQVAILTRELASAEKREAIASTKVAALEAQLERLHEQLREHLVSTKSTAGKTPSPRKRAKGA